MKPEEREMGVRMIAYNRTMEYLEKEAADMPEGAIPAGAGAGLGALLGGAAGKGTKRIPLALLGALLGGGAGIGASALAGQGGKGGGGGDGNDALIANAVSKIKGLKDMPSSGLNAVLDTIKGMGSAGDRIRGVKGPIERQMARHDVKDRLMGLTGWSK